MSSKSRVADRGSMAYAQYSDFLDRAQLLRQKLLKQDYVALKSSQHKFYGRHYQLVICWCCWNIATAEGEVDYWKSEVITYVIVFIYSNCFVNSILYFKLNWINEQQVITESRIIQ
jgi:hypothetical protein